jgi:Na+-transporting NADH:ubiquinone oxidoreductase subunit A
MGIHDVVWFIKAVDVVVIGRLFLDGAVPTTRIVSLGGPLVKEEARHHYRISAGGELGGLFKESLTDEEPRILDGDILSGIATEQDAHLRFGQSAITVIKEDKERHFVGWTMPGFNQYSFTKLVASSYLPFLKKRWNLGTNMHGEERALVLTGNYDKVVPLDIMTDFLVRAVLAGDTDEAISLGILETAPEDFALCDFICPSKMEIQSIIRQGLKDIEEEGV